MTIPRSNIINDGISGNGLTHTISGNNLLESNNLINNQDSKCDGKSTLKRNNQKQQGATHPLAALGSFFSGSKTNQGAGTTTRGDDLGSDGMSGSGSASGSSGVNNSSARNGMRNV